MDEKQDAALLPIAAQKHSEDRMQLKLLHGGDGWVVWTWDAGQLRAASKALWALADQLDEPRRNAGPGCTFTREDALKAAKGSSDRANPLAYIGDGCCVVGYAGERLYQGATWWEAAAKAGMFGSDMAVRMRRDV